MIKASPYFVPKVSFLWDLVPKKTSRYFEDRFTLCFIDVGIRNLGLAVFSVDRHWVSPSLDYIDRVDLTRLDRSATPYSGNELSDRVDRFARLYENHLSPCERVFIERQPLGGVKAVEQLLYSRYRSKAVLLSPISVHNFFQYGSRQGFDYDARKRATVNAADRIVLQYGSGQVKRRWAEMDATGEKKDDVGDPVVMALYVLKKKREEWERLYAD
jgi:hypothetical protein